MKITAVTQHAIERYMQRTGSKNLTGALNKMMASAEAGTPLGLNRFYNRGVIYVVRDGVIHTAYKPHTPDAMDAVYKAMHKKS